MKSQFYKFLLYIYINYIREDWDYINTFGKILLYPAWVHEQFNKFY